jgi:general L-amino acid transport system permease protein
MTHGRAALVGILNTLLIAFLGCILATILGVLAGVLRLSKNWLVGRLMSVYVEGFRNVPLLLWILVIFAVMTRACRSRGISAKAARLHGGLRQRRRHEPRRLHPALASPMGGGSETPAVAADACRSGADRHELRRGRIATGGAGVETGEAITARDPAP